MPAYRLYFMDNHGHISRVVELDCLDDADALDAAEAHRDGQVMELWDRARVVKTFEAPQDA
jgi:hypothetical protein